MLFPVDYSVFVPTSLADNPKIIDALGNIMLSIAEGDQVEPQRLEGDRALGETPMVRFTLRRCEAANLDAIRTILARVTKPSDELVVIEWERDDNSDAWIRLANGKAYMFMVDPYGKSVVSMKSLAASAAAYGPEYVPLVIEAGQLFDALLAPR